MCVGRGTLRAWPWDLDHIWQDTTIAYQFVQSYMIGAADHIGEYNDTQYVHNLSLFGQRLEFRLCVQLYCLDVPLR
jgi:hypothetical protein